MAAPPFHLSVLLAFLLLSTAAAVSDSQHLHHQHHGHGPHPHPHHRSARLESAPSMYHNRMESESEETRQSLRVLNRFVTVAVHPPSGQQGMAAVGAAADAGETTRLDLPSPPPPLLAAADPLPSSLAPPQPQAEEARSYQSEAAAPPPVVDEPYRDAATTPPPPPVFDEPYRDAANAPPTPPVVDKPYRDAESAPPPPPVVDEPYRDAASTPPPPPVVDEPYRDAAIPSRPPPPVVDELYHDEANPSPPGHDNAARVVSSGTGDDLGLQQIAKVLASLGYNEMASSATLPADSTPVVSWPGAITVFAAPDVFLQASCPKCLRRHLLLDHMALGYFPYAELAAAPAMKLPSASVGFCLDVAAQAQRGPFSVNHVILYVNGVMVSEPELYDDGRYVVHGLHGFIPPRSHASCGEDAQALHHHQVHLHHYRRRHRHHLGARSAASSIREAISRLRDSGFGVVALAMRVKFPELEKLANMTVFALDDQVIFTGGGHGYVSAVRFHIVPGHRLTRADLLLLRPGTMLPTLAGEDQKLVITLGAGSATDDFRINNVPVKEPDLVINSRIAVHGIYLPFPRLHLAGLSRVAHGAAHAHTPGARHGGFSSAAAAAAAAAAAIVIAGLLGLAAVAVNQRRRERRRREGKDRQSRLLLKSKLRPSDRTKCSCGEEEETKWKATVCGQKFCNSCVVNGFLHSHLLEYKNRSSFFCSSKSCELVPLEAPRMDPIYDEFFFTTEEDNSHTTTEVYVNMAQLQDREVPKRLLLSYNKSDNTLVDVRRRSP